MMNFNDMPLKNQNESEKPGKMQFILFLVPFAPCHLSILYPLQERSGEQDAVSCSAA